MSRTIVLFRITTLSCCILRALQYTLTLYSTYIAIHTHAHSHTLSHLLNISRTHAHTHTQYFPVVTVTVMSQLQGCLGPFHYTSPRTLFYRYGNTCTLSHTQALTHTHTHGLSLSHTHTHGREMFLCSHNYKDVWDPLTALLCAPYSTYMAILTPPLTHRPSLTHKKSSLSHTHTRTQTGDFPL